MVVRDHNGTVVKSGVHQVREGWCPEVAEAMAAMFGLNSARQIRLEHVVLESDNIALITMHKAKCFPSNYFGRVGKLVSELACSFVGIQFSFIRRDGNRVAPELAHLIPIDYSIRYWVGSIPERIVPFVELDIALLPS